MGGPKAVRYLRKRPFDVGRDAPAVWMLDGLAAEGVPFRDQLGVDWLVRRAATAIQATHWVMRCLHRSTDAVRGCPPGLTAKMK